MFETASSIGNSDSPCWATLTLCVFRRPLQEQVRMKFGGGVFMLLGAIGLISTIIAPRNWSEFQSLDTSWYTSCCVIGPTEEFNAHHLALSYPKSLGHCSTTFSPSPCVRLIISSVPKPYWFQLLKKARLYTIIIIYIYTVYNITRNVEPVLKLTRSGVHMDCNLANTPPNLSTLSHNSLENDIFWRTYMRVKADAHHSSADVKQANVGKDAGFGHKPVPPEGFPQRHQAAEAMINAYKQMLDQWSRIVKSHELLFLQFHSFTMNLLRILPEFNSASRTAGVCKR